jgi:hypothetical protein
MQKIFVTFAASINVLVFIGQVLPVDSKPNALMTKGVVLAYSQTQDLL